VEQLPAASASGRRTSPDSLRSEGRASDIVDPDYLTPALRTRIVTDSRTLVARWDTT